MTGHVCSRQKGLWIMLASVRLSANLIYYRCFRKRTRTSPREKTLMPVRFVRNQWTVLNCVLAFAHISRASKS